jgi:predicted enzyme related to lactoylglutathione lyase
MPDPFEALFDPVHASDPDPAFAARLRAQVEVALSLPKGVTMTTATELTTATGPSAPTETIRPGDAGYVSLWVPDAARAQRFFSEVLGWPPQGHRRVDRPALDHGIAGDVAHNTLFVCYATDDLDAAMGRVEVAGGRVEAPTDEPWGPTAMCTDNQGLRFALYELSETDRGPRPDLNGGENGDLSYVTMEVIDSASARQFYSEVLGWQFVPGRVEDGWGPVDVAPMTGMHGGHAVATIVPMYRVDDILDVVERVRAAGGSASAPEQQPYGLSSTCVDDQGTRFYLGQH